MRQAVRAGLVYFVIVFAIGFGLGSLRVLLVSPVLGERPKPGHPNPLRKRPTSGG